MMNSMSGILVSFISVLVLFSLLDETSACEDKVPQQCQHELQPHYCYLEHNRDVCCRTCRQYETNDPQCKYGDHLATIVRKDTSGNEHTYTCESYVAFYGRHHCNNEPKFKEYCCKTCKSD